MTVRNLDALVHPRSVAVIGASVRPRSIGEAVMRNLVAAGFAGPLYPVNPKYDRVLGIEAYPSIDRLPAAADMAIVCTPPATVPAIIDQLGKRGTRAAVVLTAGLSAERNAENFTLAQAMLAAGKPHLLRILGPDSVGLLTPAIGLNASFAHTDAIAGTLAFISQSNALAMAVLDRAKSRRIGFSHFISLGEGRDVDFADMIDYLGTDPGTRAVLLYIESIRNARKFMSAARAAARNKPLIVVKAGRGSEGARAAASHTGALAGADAVFDAALRRAGMLRVDTMLDLFDAAETLSHFTHLRGERLAVMSNGGGPGVMAADAAASNGVRLAELSADTVARLRGILPRAGSIANPIDIVGDAPVERYVGTLRVLADEAQADAILFIHAPSAFVPGPEIAAACAPVLRAGGKPVLSCWLGGDALHGARKLFHDAGIADYATPEEAVRAFSHLVTYRKNQEQLLETPAGALPGFEPDRTGAAHRITRVLASGRESLTEHESKAVLADYGIPVVETRIASSPEAAAATSELLGFPVALKLLSPDILHKSEVGGVALNLDSAEQVRAAAHAMRARVTHLRPEARLTGFTVQKMVRRPGACELFAGMTVDAVFGPVIVFGQGGTGVELIGDRAVALPPLNVPLARELVGRTRVARVLAGHQNQPRADCDAIHHALCRLSQLLIDIPEIVDIDINPLLADEEGVLALDARIRVASSDAGGHERLAIRPYPQELEERIDWNDRELLLRPIRPEDTRQHLRFLQRLSPHDVRMRVFHTKRYIAPSELARLTQIDYEREMAFIAAAPDGRGNTETLGVVRAVTDPENGRAEFAIVVRSDIKGKGLGRILLDKIIRYCRSRGTEVIVGDVLKENTRMLELTRQLGFAVSPSDEPGIMQVTLDLRRHDSATAPASTATAERSPASPGSSER